MKSAVCRKMSFVKPRMLSDLKYAELQLKVNLRFMFVNVTCLFIKKIFNLGLLALK